MTDMDHDIKPLLNVNDTCRTCLSQNGEMFSIFETIENEPFNVKLSDISQIQVIYEDGLPSLICDACIKLTNSAFAFKQQVKKVDAVLKQLRETKRIFNSNSENDSDTYGTYLNIQLDEKSIAVENQVKAIKIEEVCLVPNYDDQSLKDSDNNFMSNDIINNIKKNPIDISDDIKTFDQYKSFGDPAENINITKIHNNISDIKLEKNISKIKLFIKEEKYKKINKKRHEINICASCSEICVNETNLVKHMKTIHKINKPFTCDYCGCSFTGKRSLEVHINIKHTKERKFACDSCTKSFIEKRDLNRHKTVHTKRFVCDICDKEFSFRQSLNVHINMHRQSGKHPCPKCNLLFMGEYQLQRHTKVAHTNETHKCLHCHKTFSHKTRLKKHLMSHKDPKDRRWECKFCSRKFNYLHHLINHERIHTGAKPFLCNKCGKSFAQSHNLTMHLRQHESVLPHACNICEKRFAHPQRLKRHIKTHTGEKPYACKMCPKSYANSGSLKKHIKTCHGDANVNDSMEIIKSDDIIVIQNENNINSENKLTDKKISCKWCSDVFTSLNYLKLHNKSHKKHICNICKKVFTLASILKAHLQTHSGVDRSHVCKECGTGYKRLDHLKAHQRRIHAKERPFHCTQCSRSFYQNSELTVHLRRHNGEKPYSCLLCNKSFVILTELKMHERTHTGVKPFKCEVCNNSFVSASNLSAHMVYHLNKVPRAKKINVIPNDNLQTINIAQQDNAEITVNATRCNLSTKNIIFVNDSVIETYSDLANLINDNQTYLESDGTNIYLTNIEPDMKNNVNLIVAQQDIAENLNNIKGIPDNANKNNVKSKDMNVPTFNVIRAQDGKLLLQLNENLQFTVNDNIAQPVETKPIGEENFISIDDSTLLTNIDPMQNEIGQNITIVSNKATNESICFPTNAKIVYASPQQSQDAINSNTDMPSL